LSAIAGNKKKTVSSSTEMFFPLVFPNAKKEKLSQHRSKGNSHFSYAPFSLSLSLDDR